MAEAGGPALSEIQPQPAGVVDRVKGKLREMFTPTGRAEVMAQKQIDAILVQVPEDKRAEAMQILESKRPEFVAGKMEDAKGSLVRDAVAVSAVAGTVLVGAGAVYVKRDAIMNAAFSVGIPITKGDRRSLAAKDRLAGMRKANFVASIRKATDPVRGFINGMRLWPFNKLNANPKEFIPPVAK